MNRKTFIKTLSVAALAPSIIIKKVYATSSWKLNREECIGCEACVAEAPECLTIGKDGKAAFLNAHASGGPVYHYGCGYYDQMFAAKDVCPFDLIEEFGK